MGNGKYTALKVLCSARSETFHQVSAATFISSSSVENCIALKAAPPSSWKSIYVHVCVDDGLCAHAGVLASGLPTVQFLVAFLRTASNQKLDGRKAWE